MSKLQMLIWHRMFYSCTHMATVGVKGLTITSEPCAEACSMSSRHRRAADENWRRAVARRRSSYVRQI